jgi:hypothetical protein
MKSDKDHGPLSVGRMRIRPREAVRETAGADSSHDTSVAGGDEQVELRDKVYSKEFAMYDKNPRFESKGRVEENKADLGNQSRRQDGATEQVSLNACTKSC